MSEYPGVLNVGLGVVEYTQESVPSQVQLHLHSLLLSQPVILYFTQFKPTESEQRLILLLHRGIEARQGEGKRDTKKTFPFDCLLPFCIGRPGQCVSKLTKEERKSISLSGNSFNIVSCM